MVEKLYIETKAEAGEGLDERLPLLVQWLSKPQIQLPLLRIRVSASEWVGWLV